MREKHREEIKEDEIASAFSVFDVVSWSYNRVGLASKPRFLSNGRASQFR